jgi:hypothetical protein
MTGVEPAVAHPRAAPAVGTGLLLSLVAGRGAFRLTLYAANAVLAAVWTRAEFSGYAAAAGASMWLLSLVSAGPEKAALKLLPRADRTRPALLGALRGLAAVLPLPLLGAAGVALAVAPSAPATLHLVVAAQYVALGANLLLVGLYRALGRPRRDVATFLTLSVVTVAATAVTALTGLPPAAYAAVLLAATTVVNVGLLRGLRTAPARTPRRLRTLRLLATTAALMGASEVLSNAALSALYVVLALTAFAAQSAELYLVGIVWSLALSALYFLLRVFQPRTSLRYAGSAAGEGRRVAVRLARAVVALDLLWLALAGAAVLVLDLHELAPGRPTLLALAALMLARAPIVVLATTAAYLLENADGESLRVSAAAAGLGLAAVVLTGVVLVPVYGAVGAVWALAVKELAVGVTVLARVHRPAGPSQGASPGASVARTDADHARVHRPAS